jgi:hypothetical protein
MDILHIARLRRQHPRFGVAAAFVLGLAWVVVGAPDGGRADSTVSAQTLDPCALITVDEVEPLAAQTSVAAGVANSVPAFGYFACRYMWGAGTGRFKLDVTINEPSRMFPGMSPDLIKQQLLGSVRAGTADAVVPEIGDAAVFRPDSPVYASAFALVKGHLLGVHLDGVSAREKKDQVIELLKAAAARL